MLFLIVFGLIMLVLLIKALIETAYGVVLMAYATVLIAIGYTLKVLAFFLRIFECIQEQKQSRKVCFAEKSRAVKIHTNQEFSKEAGNRIPNKKFSQRPATAC